VRKVRLLPKTPRSDQGNTKTKGVRGPRSLKLGARGPDGYRLDDVVVDDALVGEASASPCGQVGAGAYGHKPTRSVRQLLRLGEAIPWLPL
jgi:hypothetical protein